MKIQVITLIFVLFYTSFASAQESSVYRCQFEEKDIQAIVKMKTYFDTTENMNIGKVVVVSNGTTLESTKIKVYEIPLMDGDSYIKIWNSPTLRLEAQLSYSHPRSIFHAQFSKNQEKTRLICQLLPP